MKPRALVWSLPTVLFLLACPETVEEQDAGADAGIHADAAAVDALQADASAADTSGIDSAARDAARADTAVADTAVADTAAADTAAADTAAADTAAADIAQPDVRQLDAAGPDSAADAATPDAGADPWPLDPNEPPLTGGAWHRPAVADTWQWQLTGALNTSYDVAIYDIDLFETAPATIAALQSQGRRVLCYFSAGSSESWRPDFDQFTADDMGRNLDGWPGERWLDIRSQNVFEIMLARLDLAADKGCDGVEPDNVDGFDNSTGFPLTATDQLAYNRAIANAAHRRGLAVALKNDVAQVDDLVDYYDLTVNEECHDYSECDTLGPFIDAGKPVLNAEYADSLGEAQGRASSLCPQAQSESFRTLILPWDLDDSFRVTCD